MLLLSILINKKGCNFLLSKNVHYMRIIIFFLIFKKYYSHFETDFVSKDALWLVSIVNLLGYTLGISLLIILGLVCLLLCKRRRELEALDISQPIERDFRLLNYFSYRNVDRVASNINSRNNINISEVLFWNFPCRKNRRQK